MQSDCIALCWLHFHYGGESCRNQQILTENSGKVKPFLFSFTIGKWNLIYSECVGESFILICWVFYDSQGQT